MNALPRKTLLLLALLAGLGLILSPFRRPLPASANPGLAAAPAALGDPIILEGPTTLTPPFTTQCASYWYRYTNDRNQLAYLTLNVKDPARTYNKAEWRTILPEVAIYRIEAYIPPHDPLFWDCTTDYATLGDTLTARYEIVLLDHSVFVTVDQAANAGKWVSLGDYLLSSSPGATVRITDLTSEPANERTVSVSALRFTKVAPGYRQISPTILGNSYPQGGVYMQYGMVSDDFGNLLSRFDMEEVINLGMSGYNDSPVTQTTQATWQLEGPCSAVNILHAEVREAETGTWQESYRTTAPPCTGPYTMTVTLAFQERFFSLQKPYQVDPGTRMGVMQQQGFDKCEITSIPNMQAWWEKSPYYAVNLYIGGMNRACSNSLLTRDWVKQVQAQGWSFIPTWVGRQAPCMTRDMDKISIDPAAAYAEGLAEAADATKVASRLGLFEARTRSSVIYLDIEGYRWSATYTPECRTATNSFVSGWVDGMHKAGLEAGVYGGVCSSYMADWATLPNPPDAVWGAYWNLDPVYNPEETVWGWACVSDTLWADQQRIAQYAGDHPETWGNVTLGGIDSNAIDTILPAPRQVATPVPADAEGSVSSAPVTVQGLPLGDFLPLGPGQGWLLSGGQVFWTDNGGQSWHAAGLPSEALSAELADGQAGWLEIAGHEDIRLGWEMGRGGPQWSLALPGQSEPGSPPYADLSTLKGVDLAQDASLPEGAAGLRTAPDGTLWIYSANGACQGVKGTSGFACSMVYKLSESRDGGLTWSEILLPQAYFETDGR